MIALCTKHDRRPGYISDALKAIPTGQTRLVPNEIGFGCIPATCAFLSKAYDRTYTWDQRARRVKRIR